MTGKAQDILALNAFSDAASGTLDKDVAALIKRRRRSFGAASVIVYRHPIKIERAEGATIYASDGRAYLDFYNNVPAVGHSHPKVVEAVSRQLAAFNTHSRYLYDIVHDYAERLLKLFPAGLSNVVFTCTGSESNDLALRVAKKASGGTGFIHDITHETSNGGIVDGAADVIAKTVQTRFGPGCDRDGDPLWLVAFLLGHANVRKHFQLLHMNRVLRKIRRRLHF